MQKNTITAQDLEAAAALAQAFALSTEEPLVLAGALAMACHGYRRETHDVDIVIAAPVNAKMLKAEAEKLGMTIRAEHSFGGFDLRVGDIRIDVLTLERDMPDLITEAVREAMVSRRTASVFGQEMYIVSIGHLIAMKLLAERKKDLADIVELIKARIESGDWKNDWYPARAIVKKHLGWYAAKKMDELAEEAQEELAGR